MQQLTGLDAAFLALETANSTGHVGGVCILDPRDAPAPLTLARLTEVLAGRLPLVPVLRRKLLTVPLGLDQPYCAAARTAAGPQPPAVGDLPHHRARQAPGCRLYQDPPLGHRRCVWRGAADDPAGRP